MPESATSFPCPDIKEASVTRRKFLLLLLLAASIAAPLWAGTHSTAAFKKLQSLSGDWEGKDGHGMAGGAGLRPRDVRGGPCFRFLKAWGF
jgi:hypothetical protein